MNLSTILPLLLLRVLPISAAARPGGPGAVMAGTTLRTLENGLRVVVREQHGTGLMAIDLWVRAGSGSERTAESGAAHFLEHLLFKGTPTRKPGEIDAAFEDLGSALSAGTTRDGAHFYSTVASKYLERSLDVLSDAVQHSLFAPEEIERERAVILDELARGRNEWQRQAVDTLREALYPNDPYGRPILGTSEALRKIQRDTIVGFFTRLYAPNNATLVLVGDATPEVAEGAARKAFGSWPKREAIPVLKSAPPDPPAGPRREVAAGRLAVVAAGFRGPEGSDTVSVCAADVLATLLADPAGGRVTEAAKKLCAPGNVGADSTTLRGPSVFSVYAATEPVKLTELQGVIDAELRRLGTAAPSTAEVEWARRRTLASYLFDIETYGGQARELGSWDMIGSYELAMTYPAAVAQVKPADIAAFVTHFLDPAHAARAIFIPKDAK
jgi:zinc protease